MKMSPVSKVLSLAAVCGGVCWPLGTLAQQASAAQPQEKRFVSPNGVSEICRIPQKLVAPELAQGDFKKKDLEKETELCNLDLHATMGLCPKMFDTNPGILINQLPENMSKGTFEANHCVKRDDPKKDVVAKFEQSITCSYAPSALAAYQLSRLMGGIGRVPVAVVRTMDKKIHKSLVDKALVTPVPSYEEPIKASWKAYLRAYEAATPSRNIFTADGQVYGALSDNPSGEEKYSEVSGRGAYDTRYERFVQQKPYLRVADDRSVEAIAGSREMKDLVPTIVQMKDVSDMVLLDTLLSQDDRIGNIHFKFRWYYLEDGKMKEEKSKAEKPLKDLDKRINYRNAIFPAIVPQKELQEMQAKDAILVKEILLKDNDCGVDVARRTNGMRRVNAIENLRHMSQETYTKFRRLAQYVRTNKGLVQDYFVKELLFKAVDFDGSPKSFMANLEKAEQSLVKNCRNGSLKLDLDLDQYLPGAQPVATNCEI